MHRARWTPVKRKVTMKVPQTSQRSYFPVTHSHTRCLSPPRRGHDTSDTSQRAVPPSVSLSLWQVDMAQSVWTSMALGPRGSFSLLWPRRWTLVSYLPSPPGALRCCLEVKIKILSVCLLSAVISFNWQLSIILHPWRVKDFLGL